MEENTDGRGWMCIRQPANVPDPIHAKLVEMQMDSIVARFAFFGSLAREEEESVDFLIAKKSRNKRDYLNYTIEGAWKRSKKNTRYLLLAYAFLDVLWWAD